MENHFKITLLKYKLIKNNIPIWIYFHTRLAIGVLNTFTLRRLQLYLYFSYSIYCKENYHENLSSKRYSTNTCSIYPLRLKFNLQAHK